MGGLSRRDLMGSLAGIVAFRDDTLRILASLTRESEPDPEDEAYWSALRSAFYVHPTLTVFNHVGINPPPIAVEEAMVRESRRAASDPSYVIWRQQDHELQPIRDDLAEIVGCKNTEIALVPNATYGLHTVISGVPMTAGDDIVLPSEEYPRSFTAAEQRARREKTVVRMADFEGKVLSDDEVVKRVLGQVTPKTKLVVLSEVTYLLGRRLPITAIEAELAKRGVPVLLDGSQSIGLVEKHAPSSMFAACLHKWMMGPVGTGILVIKEPWIPLVWPLHPATEDLGGNMDKFRQVGTHPTAPFLALRESIDLHHRIGWKAKAGRLQYLRKKIAAGVDGSKKIQIVNSLDPAVCMPFLTLRIEGTDSADLAGRLMRDHKIHVTTAVRAGVDGIRISPNLFTSLGEIDRLTMALKTLAESSI
ncbi:MAG: aminotransferase class V-fold PLP-dependent enzyme [Armatimonadetes bacterium]|nr:aminotransferase class V-fold PLP-dependent enzyme [Armatimonadota bacterium]